jgi:hypothetical protein
MPQPNVGELDARLRQMVAGAGFLFAANAWKKHPIVALAATVAAVDLAATAAARWCWTLEMLNLDTRVLDPPRVTSARRGWMPQPGASVHRSATT